PPPAVQPATLAPTLLALICGLPLAWFALSPATAHAQSSSEAEAMRSSESSLLEAHPDLKGMTIIPTNFDTLMEFLNNHATWKAQKEAHIGAAEAGRKLARAFEDPEFSYEFEAFTGHGTDYVDGSQHEFMLEWELPLQRIRAARTAVVDAEVEHARAEFAENTWALAQSLREAWQTVEIEYARAAALQDAINH